MDPDQTALGAICDQTAPGAICSGSALFAYAILSLTLVYKILCRPGWLSGMRIRLVIRRLRVQPLQVSNMILRRLIMKYFYSHSLPSADSRRAVVSFW